MDTLERAMKRPADLDSYQVVDRGTQPPSPPLIPLTSRGNMFMRSAMPGNLSMPGDIHRQTVSLASAQRRPFIPLSQAVAANASPAALQASTGVSKSLSGLSLNDIANSTRYTKVLKTQVNTDGTLVDQTLPLLQDSRQPQVTRLDLDELKATIASLAFSQPQVTQADLQEIRNIISSLDVPRSYQADLDEIRVLIASLDTPRGPSFWNWGSWTPTFSCSGSMTFALASIAYAYYIQLGGTVFYAIQVNFTLGGTASTSVFATLPVPALALPGNFSVNTNIINGGTAPWIPSFGSVDNSVNQRFNIATPTGANWTLGGAWFSSQGFYRAN